MQRRYHTKRATRRRASRARACALACGLGVALAAACGGEEPPDQSPAAAADFRWPEGPRATAVITTRDHGEIRFALYPELAPVTVSQFEKRAGDGFYDGVTFHRVIPGFMIQGGDPLSRDNDPRNDGQGGPPGPPLPDEFSAAPFLRGTVAMANTGRPDSGGSQFFIVDSETHDLDGQYSLFGRVTEGLETVDAIAAVPTDVGGRFGPAHRPIESVVIERIRIEPAEPGETSDPTR
ncbi:MAG: peptidylprolyl isomerase [Myxococcota bacterium]|nr:peptidylprolyl isomerase [Myxococcota bacterium]